MNARQDILELARFLTELSVIDYFFVVYRPSVVAIAALMNSLDIIPQVSKTALRDLEVEFERMTGLDPSRPEVSECRDRLHVLYEQGGYTRPEILLQTEEILLNEERDDTVSPVCVTQGVNHESFDKSSVGETPESPSSPEVIIQ